jgi:nucleoside-triphosphatase THEP1
MVTTFLMGFASVAKATGVMTAKLSSERTMTGYNVVALNKGRSPVGLPEQRVEFYIRQGERPCQVLAKD